MQIIVTEQEARKLEICPVEGCGTGKAKGMLVCWNCWRNSLKWSGVDFTTWLKGINKLNIQGK